MLKSYKSLGIDQIPAELIQAGGNALRSENHKCINSIWNKEELPQQWKESVVVPTYKRTTEMTNSYRGISLIPPSYKIIFSIVSRLTS
jgi:hypothetical protein